VAGGYGGEAAHFPNAGIPGSGLAAEELRKGVLEHVWTHGWQQPPASHDFPVVVLADHVDRLMFVKAIDFESITALHFPAETLMEHLVPEPVHPADHLFVNLYIVRLERHNALHVFILLGQGLEELKHGPCFI
jgi:hypothetical protein